MTRVHMAELETRFPEGLLYLGMLPRELAAVVGIGDRLSSHDQAALGVDAGLPVVTWDAPATVDALHLQSVRIGQVYTVPHAVVAMHALLPLLDALKALFVELLLLLKPVKLSTELLGLRTLCVRQLALFQVLLDAFLNRSQMTLDLFGGEALAVLDPGVLLD